MDNIRQQITSAFNYLMSAGGNEVINNIPQEHRNYAQLINKTYLADRENFGDYEYKKSLYMPNTMIGALFAGATGIAGEKLLPDAIKKITRVKQGLSSELAGRDMRPSQNYLSFLFDTVRTSEFLMETEGATFLDREDTGLDYDIPMTDVWEEYWYEPNIPMGFFAIPLYAILYQKALGDIKMSDKPNNSAPRINYYRRGDEDIFAVRGTNGWEDLVNDGEMAILGKFSPLIAKKLQIYEEFINKNARGNKITLVGHSLGSLEINMLKEKMKSKDINAVGYGHPVYKPHPDATVYTYKHDPLYVPSGMSNHKILVKPKSNKFLLHDTKHHSITNYF